MDLGLKGKVALVAGASQGMGRATALLFAREGAKVGMCARGEAALNETAQMIRRETGGEVLAIVADMTKAEDIQRFVNQIAEHYGRLDIIVNNAGGPPPGEFMKFTDEIGAAFNLSFMSTMHDVRQCRTCARSAAAASSTSHPTGQGAHRGWFFERDPQRVIGLAKPAGAGAGQYSHQQRLPANRYRVGAKAQ
jgi:3-oxoacyl-[acyl-carrier protein] reductase